MYPLISRALTLALITLPLVACSGNAPASVAGGRHPYTHPHELRLVIGDIESLNPLISSSRPEMYLAKLCMAFLIRTDARGDAAVPELITALPSRRNGGLSRDGKTITWHLRHGVRWSDGAPFDADDVVFSTRQVLNPANNVASLDGWDLITKIDEPNKYTVVYHLKRPYSSFALTFFSTGGANPAVMPAHLLRGLPNLTTTPYNSLPVGIGPFKYVSWNRGNSVVMVRDPKYFRGRAKLDRIVFKLVSSTTTPLVQLRTHEIDLWLGLSPHLYAQAVAIPGIAGSSVTGYTFDHIDFNLSRPILHDHALREALRYATDRHAIIEKVFDGVYLPSESPVAVTSRYYLNLPLVPFDLVKANALLDADGWKRGTDGIRENDGRRLSLEIACVGSEYVNTELELIRAWWREIGVEITVKRYPAPLMFATVANGGIMYGGKFDIAIFGWEADSNEDLSNYYACYRFPPVGQNDLHWCDRATTADLDVAKESYDPAVRKVAIDAVQRALYEQVPTIIVDNRRDLAVYNDDLKGWRVSGSSLDNMMFVDI